MKYKIADGVTGGMLQDAERAKETLRKQLDNMEKDVKVLVKCIEQQQTSSLECQVLVEKYK